MFWWMAKAYGVLTRRLACGARQGRKHGGAQAGRRRQGGAGRAVLQPGCTAAAQLPATARIQGSWTAAAQLSAEPSGASGPGRTCTQVPGMAPQRASTVSGISRGSNGCAPRYLHGREQRQQRQQSSGWAGLGGKAGRERSSQVYPAGISRASRGTLQATAAGSRSSPIAVRRPAPLGRQAREPGTGRWGAAEAHVIDWIGMMGGLMPPVSRRTNSRSVPLTAFTPSSVRPAGGRGEAFSCGCEAHEARMVGGAGCAGYPETT